MCGICGLIYPKGKDVERTILERMNNSMRHRGPDGEGIYIDGNVGLAHRRLSIIDLEGGAQPLANEDGTIIVTFNGEIYNYRELSEFCTKKGHRFQTQSDTETLVHLYEEFGIDMLSRLRGMFAFALYDRTRQQVFLVRDRFGIKPVYFSYQNGIFGFASEIKALLSFGFSTDINYLALHQYFQTRFCHDDETIFRGIHRLPEGSFLLFKNGSFTINQWYPNPNHDSSNDNLNYEELFEEAFTDAVSSHMIADVPVGAYLSGGVDSSTIVSEMARLTKYPIQTFCVDFEGERSEAAAAEKTARLLGCEHHTVYCGLDDLLNIHKVIEFLEEPVGDGVIVAQYILSRETQRAGTKVVLTGDGADETLGGYQHLRAIIDALKWTRFVPKQVVVPVLSRIVEFIPKRVINYLANLPFNVAEEARGKLLLLLGSIKKRDIREMYDILLSLFMPNELKGMYTSSFHSLIREFSPSYFAGKLCGSSVADQVLSMQYRKWLPANINLKQDKLCMAHSVENRVPFLDHKFVERMISFPIRVKIQGRKNKILLRELCNKRLGRGTISGNKVPFHLPLENYIHDRRFWELVEDCLSEERIKKRNIVNSSYVSMLKKKSREEDYLIVKKMFSLVILELWFRIFIDRENL